MNGRQNSWIGDHSMLAVSGHTDLLCHTDAAHSSAVKHALGFMASAMSALYGGYVSFVCHIRDGN